MSKDEAKLDPYALAEAYIVARHTKNPGSGISCELQLRYWRDEWVLYRDGCYCRWGLPELKADIVGYLHGQQIGINPHYINSILLALTHLCLIDSRQELNAWLNEINGANVFVAANGNVSHSDRDPAGKRRLLPHTPWYFTMSRLPYDYNPAATCPGWLAFLEDVLDGNREYMRLLQEWCGYLFRPDLREQKFLLCVGEGAIGKGVTFEIIEALVGRENCSQVSLTRFGNAFGLANTVGKVLNATNESSAFVEDEAETILKAFVAGDRLTFERKFKEPIHAVPTAKVMIATNALPRFTDKTMGIWRRILLLPFAKTIEEERQSRTLAADIIANELPGILNWGLQGLDQLNQQGFTRPEKSRELLEQYRRDADPCRDFLCENFTFSPNAAGEDSGAVYATYRQFCTANGCQALNERNFGRQVHRIFPEAERRRTGPRDNRRYIYTGLVGAEEYAVSHVSQVNPI